MRAEVKRSGPKVCLNCGEIVRILYIDGENHGLVELNPIPGTENKNPIHRTHKCIEPDDEEEDLDIFCPICNQEHNALHELNAGYCQNCKEPIIDYSTGEFFGAGVVQR